MFDKIKAYGVLDFIIHKNDIWFICSWFNYLFCMDCNSMKVIKAIRLPIGNALCTQTTAMLTLFRENGYIYIIPYKSENKIIKFDISTNQCMLVDIQLKEHNWGECKGEDEEYIYLAIKNETRLVRIKKNDLNVDYIPILGLQDEYGFAVVTRVKGGFALKQVHNGNIIFTDMEGRVKEIIKEKPNAFYMKFNGMYQGYAVCDNNKMILFPNHGNMILQIDLEEGGVSEAQKFIDCKKLNNSENLSIFTCAKRIKGYILVYMNFTDEWIYFRENGDIEKRFKMKFEEEIVRIVEKNIFDSIEPGSLFQESGLFSLSTFFELVKKSNCNRYKDL